MSEDVERLAREARKRSEETHLKKILWVLYEAGEYQTFMDFQLAQATGIEEKMA